MSLRTIGDPAPHALLEGSKVQGGGVEGRLLPSGRCGRRHVVAGREPTPDLIRECSPTSPMRLLVVLLIVFIPATFPGSPAERHLPGDIVEAGNQGLHRLVERASRDFPRAAIQEGVLQQLGDGGAVAWLGLEAPAEHLQQVRLRRLRMVLQAVAGREVDRQLGIRNRCDSLRGRQIVERSLAIGNLVQDDTQGPNVGGSACLYRRDARTLPDHLRSYVTDRSQRPSVPVDVGRLDSHPLRDAKIDQLQPPAGQQEVPGLQVAVDDAPLVDGLHCLQHLPPKHLQVAQAEALPVEQPSEIHLPQLHHDVDGILLVENLRIDDAHHLWAILEMHQQVDLLRQDLEVGLRVRGHALQRQPELRLPAVRPPHLEDLASSPAADLPQQLVGHPVDDNDLRGRPSRGAGG
mmetsp:Transcript_49437/g.132730  ORF Transcript_49437/g.132730 Transcript_49437/m.132730 type:complete len:405 (+) Transcript_49437:547-1761(+)